MMPFSPATMMKLISYWPPFFVSGIHVKEASPDMTRIVAGLNIRFWNRNYVGTHFGGSLFSLCDPFYMFMLLHHLKDEHIVWDFTANIQFIKAVSEPVTATFTVPHDRIQDIKDAALKQFKVEPCFETEITTSAGTVVARVQKKLYVRRKDAKERFGAELSSAQHNIRK